MRFLLKTLLDSSQGRKSHPHLHPRGYTVPSQKRLTRFLSIYIARTTGFVKVRKLDRNKAEFLLKVYICD